MTFATLFLAAAAVAQPMPAFMAGCWHSIDGEAWAQECWMEPKAGLMLGAGREGQGDTLKAWEQMRIVQGRDGKLVLFASPKGRAAVPFEARTVSASAVEFVNAAHDYPQRISFNTNGEKLEAEISLLDGSKPMRWRYVREKP